MNGQLGSQLSLRSIDQRGLLSVHLPLFAAKICHLELQPHQLRWGRNLRQLRLLQLAPRDHGKSEFFSHIYPLWLICARPNLRVLIVSKDDKEATKYVASIKRDLESNPALLRWFGDLTAEKEKWTQKILIRKRTVNLKDPTLEGVGFKGTITGGHFDLIVCDDIIEDEDCRTEGNRQFTSQRFHGTIMQLVEPWSQVIVVGTRKHWADLYSELLENPVWFSTVDQAIQQWPSNHEPLKDPQGQVIGAKVEGESRVLWPEKWPIEKLLLDRLTIGEVLFEREKQNNPTLMRGQTLKLEWLSYYDAIPENSTRVQFWDLAISENPEADWTVCVTLARDTSNTLYVEDVFRAHLDFPSQCKAISTLYNRFKPDMVGVESTAYQRSLAQWVRDNTLIPIREVQQVRNKIERITALGPQFENGRIKLHKSQQDFLREYLEFPSGAHDDQLDALEGALQLATQSFIGIIGAKRIT